MRQGSKALARSGFPSMRRVLVLYSQPIRFARFDDKSMNCRLPLFDQAKALDPCRRSEGSCALETRMGKSVNRAAVLDKARTAGEKQHGFWEREWVHRNDKTTDHNNDDDDGDDHDHDDEEEEEDDNDDNNNDKNDNDNDNNYNNNNVNINNNDNDNNNNNNNNNNNVFAIRSVTAQVLVGPCKQLNRKYPTGRRRPR